LLPAPAVAQGVPEQDLKAAFVYNFLLFTDWPSDVAADGATVNLCVNQNSALRQSLSGLHGKPAKGKRVEVRALAGIDGLSSCHVLVVDGNDRNRWPQIRKALDSQSILTIADDEDIGHDGSMISLAMAESRIVFDIDTRPARQARLVLSSKLLRLARKVR